MTIITEKGNRKVMKNHLLTLFNGIVDEERSTLNDN